MDKSVIINRIIKESESKTYLEIGYGDGYNFDKVKCKFRYACDPGFKTNDNIFRNILPVDSNTFFSNNEKDFDVIFIDGLHHAEQVRKDIANAMKVGAKAIILHDTLPKDEAMQKVPREQKEWTGDVWRSAVGFHESYPDVKFETYKSDYGLTVIYPEGKKTRKHFENTEMAFDYFVENSKSLLNIID